MAWTTPRTWIAAEVVAASTMNAHVRDNLNALDHPVLLEATAIDVLNTATETSIFSSAPSIAAGSMGSNGIVRALLNGTYKRNSGASFQLRGTFGGTDFLLVSWDFTSSATTFFWALEIEIRNVGSASVQEIRTKLRGTTAGSLGTLTFTTGAGGIDTGAGILDGYSANAGAVNTGSAAVLDVKAKWTTTVTDVSFKRTSAHVLQAAR